MIEAGVDQAGLPLQKHVKRPRLLRLVSWLGVSTAVLLTARPDKALQLNEQQPELPPEESLPKSGRSRLPRVARLTWTVLSWLGVIAAVVSLIGVLSVVVGPRLLGWQSVIILTGSMEPELMTGGVAFVEPVKDAADIVRGDIITFTLTDRNNRITHRVVDIAGSDGALQFITRGDANDSNDSWVVTAENLSGRVVFDLPYLGTAVDALREKENFYIVIGIPASLLILSELWNIFQEMRRPRRPEGGAAS